MPNSFNHLHTLYFQETNTNELKEIELNVKITAEKAKNKNILIQQIDEQPATNDDTAVQVYETKDMITNFVNDIILQSVASVENSLERSLERELFDHETREFQVLDYATDQ